VVRKKEVNINHALDKPRFCYRYSIWKDWFCRNGGTKEGGVALFSSTPLLHFTAVKTKVLIEVKRLMEPQKQPWDQEMDGKGKPAEPVKKYSFTVGPGSNQ